MPWGKLTEVRLPICTNEPSEHRLLTHHSPKLPDIPTRTPIQELTRSSVPTFSAVVRSGIRGACADHSQSCDFAQAAMMVGSQMVGTQATVTKCLLLLWMQLSG